MLKPRERRVLDLLDAAPDDESIPPRVKLGAPVQCVVAGDARVLAAQTVDVSLSGALLQCSSKPAVGVELCLWFSFFPGSSEVPVRARVVRHAEEGFAVQFIAPEAAQRVMLRRALPAGVDARR